MAGLFENQYVTVGLEQGSTFIRYTRTDEPYPSNEEFVRCNDELCRKLDQHGRAGRLLLVDLRKAPLNNDRGFEHSATSVRAMLLRDFARVAVLVTTAVGSLQVRRHIREDGRDVGVFQDEVDALAYLLRADSVRPPPSVRGTEPPSSRNIPRPPRRPSRP